MGKFKKIVLYVTSLVPLSIIAAASGCADLQVQSITIHAPTKVKANATNYLSATVTIYNAGPDPIEAKLLPRTSSDSGSYLQIIDSEVIFGMLHIGRMEPGQTVIKDISMSVTIYETGLKNFTFEAEIIGLTTDGNEWQDPDTSNNIKTVTFQIAGDASPPQFIQESPVPLGTYFFVDPVPINFTVSDPETGIKDVTVTFDGHDLTLLRTVSAETALFGNCPASITFTGQVGPLLSSGFHTIVVLVLNEVGHATKATMTFIVTMEAKPSVTFLDKDKKPISSLEGLKVAKWEQAFAKSGSETVAKLVESDADRFFVKIEGGSAKAGSKGTIRIKDSTGEAMDNITDTVFKDDGQGNIVAGPFIITFSDKDDSHIDKVQYGGTDDRSLLLFKPDKLQSLPEKVKVEGEVTLVRLDGKEMGEKGTNIKICPASGTQPLKTVNVHVVVFGETKEKPLISDTAIHQSFAVTRSEWSQCCIDFKVSIEKFTFAEALAKNVDLGNGLATSGEGVDPAQEEADLIKGFQDDDASTIDLFVITGFTNRDELLGKSYIPKFFTDKKGLTDVTRAIVVRADQIGFAVDKPKNYTLIAHELGHIIMDHPFHADFQIDGKPDGKDLIFTIDVFGNVMFVVGTDTFRYAPFQNTTGQGKFTFKTEGKNIDAIRLEILKALNETPIGVTGTFENLITGAKEEGVAGTVSLNAALNIGVPQVIDVSSTVTVKGQTINMHRRDKSYNFTAKAGLEVLDHLRLSNLMASKPSAEDTEIASKRLTSAQCKGAHLFK